MMNDMSGSGGGAGGFNDPMGGDKPITVSSVLNEFRGIKDKFKNEDEDDCECCFPSVVSYIRLTDVRRRLPLSFEAKPNPIATEVGQSLLPGLGTRSSLSLAEWGSGAWGCVVVLDPAMMR